MIEPPEYRNYWERKRLLERSLPHFPVVRWWESTGLCEIEQIYFQAVSSTRDLLDIGAGDLKFKRKILAAGFSGRYDSQDIGAEFEYDFRDLSEIDHQYGAIVCLDLIEHLPLREGLELLDRLIALLEIDGVLILQTPNARCVRHPLSTDMTHLHCYNVQDLWAYLTSLGLSVDGYRVVFRHPKPSLVSRAKSLFSDFIATRLLGCDYADNIGLITRKSGPVQSGHNS